MNEKNFFSSSPEKKEQPQYKFVLNENKKHENGKVHSFVVTPATSADWPIMEKIEKIYPIQDRTIFSVHDSYLTETIREQAEQWLMRLNDPTIQKQLLKLADEYEKVSEAFFAMDDESSVDALGLQAHMEQLKDQVKALIEEGG